MDYNEYTRFRNETAAKRDVYERLRRLQVRKEGGREEIPDYYSTDNG